MTVVNLTSIEHTASLLSDRTLTNNVADDLSRHINVATNMISAHLRTTFTTQMQTRVFDISPGFSDTPGAFKTPFTQSYRPRFKLPVTGTVNNLVVKYRGSTPLEAGFSWADVDALVEYDDYLYDQVTGEIRLQFAPHAMPHGLYASYQEGYATTPDMLYGSKREKHLYQLGVETALSPLGLLFAGLPRKEFTSSAKTDAVQPALASIEVAPPQTIAAHRVRIYAPQDRAIVADTQEVVITLKAGPSGGETLLGQLTLPTPLEGQEYILSADPDTAYDRYLVEFTGTLDTNLSVSLVDFDFVDAGVLHMRGSAPEPLCTACAMLAVYLYHKTARDGVGKDADTSNRTYSSGAIPPEIRQILKPYKNQRISFV